MARVADIIPTEGTKVPNDLTLRRQSLLLASIRTLLHNLDLWGAAGDSAVTAKAGIDRRVVVVIIVVAVLITSGVVVLVVTNTPTSLTTEANTSISVGANSIIASAVQTNSAGFRLEFSKPTSPGSNVQMSDWAILDQSDGSSANVTVTEYSSAVTSQAYFNKFTASVKGLPGYVDISSDLTSFQQYGKCYGYGEDLEGIAVVNGVCTKGNVFIQVHLNSSITFPDLEEDLTSIMGALYQGAT